ncbi:MAG: methionine--tRNA ligase [Desulfopila sp.]
MTTYITTPIYYVNAQPHLGHAYTTIVADTYSRFRRLCGERVRFQTGTDEHGDKIVEAAMNDNVPAREYVDRISGMFSATWPILEVAPDNFIRTTDVAHIAVVQQILQQVYDAGDIYFDEYSGLYCRGCERFLTEKELVDGNCPDHQRPPQEIAEQNYFFRMSKYQQRLIDHIRANPEFITPERYRNEVLSFLSEPLEDLCISRPKTRLTWGIELPFDDNFVTYVWFDALINYLSGLDYPAGEDYRTFWPVAEHLIAKDILKPHAIYWPTMLLSMGVPLYKRLHVHGSWNVDNTKMSKSIGNVVRPRELVDAYGVDTLRYFILREMSFGLDASFSSEAIVARKNSDLANDLGNLYSRSLTMVNKYCKGVVPAPGGEDESDRLLRQTAEKVVPLYRENMADFQFHRALQAVWELVSHANKYIVANEPWALAKQSDGDERLATVLYNLMESLRMLALLLRPVMPATAARMVAGLGMAEDDPAANLLEVGGHWGVLRPGGRLQPIEALFPRIDLREHMGKTKKTERKDVPVSGDGDEGNAPGAMEGVITFEQFKEVEIRVAEVVAAEKIKTSDRLLKLTVKAPEERTIVAGIAAHYLPEELIGRQVLIVANLKPARLMGVQSQGMVLAAKTEVDGVEKLVLATVGDQVKTGSRVA